MVFPKSLIYTFWVLVVCGSLAIGACSDDAQPSGLLVISGVTLAGASVTADVSGITFSSVADGSGRYRVNIAEANPGDVVVLFADGSGARSQDDVRFASSLDTVEMLLARAGADRLLDQNEHAGTRISALTATAQYGALDEPKTYAWALQDDGRLRLDYPDGTSSSLRF
ncbi:MAG: hypothetical protein AAF449_15460 [Myxococcota bacterium]